MYKLLLISKYLRRKLAPLFAALAVTLCTAMVIIVISVMGGFLDMMGQAARTLTGDVTISADLTGFPQYQELGDRLEALPEVQAVTPIVRSYGLLNLHGRVLTVEIQGIEPRSFTEVTGFKDTLYWTSDDFADWTLRGAGSAPEAQERAQRQAETYRNLDVRDWAMDMQPPEHWPQAPGAVLGIEVSPSNIRNEEGRYSLINSPLASQITLTALPLTQRGALLEPAVRQFTAVGEFKSGLYDVDANRVYVPFNVLQKMLLMDPAQRVNPETGEPLDQRTPGRASELLIRGAGDLPSSELAAIVRDVVRQMQAEHPDMPAVWVETWQERHSILQAVQREKLLLTILFAIISLVAVAMIGVIFYMIVLEKTRDIGTLRAIGASRAGVASIFLGYGLAIGVVGSLAGLGIAAAVVLNINDLQDFLANQLGMTRIWDPSVYYFERIPSQLDSSEVTVIVLAAIASSVLGSVVPAILGARLNPVESLRYE